MTTPVLDTCPRCQRPMRPRGLPAHEAPGTVSTGSRGYCSSCYTALRKLDALDTRSHRIDRAGSAPVEQPNSACVLVRIDVKPATYKTLRRAKLNIGAELARYADLMARQLEARNA